MKRNLFITCALGLLSCAFSVQASDPWNYYRAGSSYSSPSYTQKYDSTFGMSIKGVYGIAGDSTMPDIGGGFLSLNSYTETGDIVHELSLTTGLLSSENKQQWSYPFDTALLSTAQQNLLLNSYGIKHAEGTISAKAKIQTSIPLLAGYTVNLPLVQEKAYFFLGGKIGVTFNTLNATIYGNALVTDRNDRLHRINESYSSRASSTDFTFTLTKGFRFAIGKSTDLIIGYELLKYKDADPYHVIEAGISWTF